MINNVIPKVNVRRHERFSFYGPRKTDTDLIFYNLCWPNYYQKNSNFLSATSNVRLLSLTIARCNGTICQPSPDWVCLVPG